MDKDILMRLYETYSREIWLYLFSLSHSGSLADDLMQETFLKAILSLSDTHTNMRAWLYKVARNLYLNDRKKKGREELSDEPVSFSGESIKEDEILEQLIRNERKQTLYRALGQLDARKREILFLQYFSGLNQRQIAATLQISPENVRIIAHRAKKELKTIMEENGYDIS